MIHIVAMLALISIHWPSSAWPTDSMQSRVYKVGISEWTGYPDSVKGFKDAMTKAGLVEGSNVVYLDQLSAANPIRQREIGKFFNAEAVDLVYSLTTPGTLIMKQVIDQTIPIIFSIVTYPSDSGLIESSEYSGNNLVGTSNYVEITNYIRLLQIALPQARSIAIFRKDKEPNSKIQTANMIRLAKREGIKVIDTPLESVEEVRDAALRLADHVDVFMTTTDTLMQSGGEKALIEVSLDKKVPIMSSNKIGIEQGSTFGIVADFYVLGQMSGEMAARIMKENIRPERLQSRTQEPPLTLINVTSSELLGINIPVDKLKNVKFVE